MYNSYGHCEPPHALISVNSETMVTKCDFLSRFAGIHLDTLLVENNTQCMEFIKVDSIIKILCVLMDMSNEGLTYKWLYRKKTCFALLDWEGCWHMSINTDYIPMPLDSCTLMCSENTMSTFKDLSYIMEYVNKYARG
jgi:hypothetical protein